MYYLDHIIFLRKIFLKHGKKIRFVCVYLLWLHVDHNVVKSPDGNHHYIIILVLKHNFLLSSG